MRASWKRRSSPTHSSVIPPRQRCSRCRDPISYFEWCELRHMLLADLELHPAGDTMLSGLDEWLTALACGSTKCKKVSCSAESGVPPESITDHDWCVAASTGSAKGIDNIEVISLEVGALDESSLAISTL